MLPFKRNWNIAVAHIRLLLYVPIYREGGKRGSQFAIFRQNRHDRNLLVEFDVKVKQTKKV